MPVKQRNRWIGATVLLFAVCGCKEDKPIKADPALAPAELSSAKPPEAPTEPPATGCKATGDKPIELGSTKGALFGMVGDATHLYATSWQTLGNRGDLLKVRKDGGGTLALTSLQLEPRALAVDKRDIYFSEGIRLAKIAKEGGNSTVIAPKFSSQYIALNATHVFGVPGDYGPYDRLVKMEKTGGVNFEIDVAERPDTKSGPVGYSAVAVDESGVYVTDSGNHRVLRFTLERAKPKVIATGQPKAFDLAIDSENLYFTLADKGLLMRMPKAGGGAKKLTAGLVPKSRIAADEAGVLGAFVGADAKAPLEIAVVPRDGGERKRYATVPNENSVEGLALDQACVYWATRTPGTGAITFYAAAR
jgi:hypothetical protein